MPENGPYVEKRRALFDAMIREDDDEKRAELRRQYVMSITLVDPPRPRLRCALFGHSWRQGFHSDPGRWFRLHCRRCGQVGAVDPRTRIWG
jgi:hypothetical protein